MSECNYSKCDVQGVAAVTIFSDPFILSFRRYSNDSRFWLTGVIAAA
jgi:hypothetical protein